VVKIGGKWNYKRFKELGRPSVNEYRRRVVDDSNKKVTNTEITCHKCGFKARYKFVRCPECEELRK